MSKKHFRFITYLIGISLIGLIGIQVLWLTKIYGGMNDEFSQKVNSAMDKAAYEEIYMRTNNGNEYTIELNSEPTFYTTGNVQLKNTTFNVIDNTRLSLPDSIKDSLTGSIEGSIMIRRSSDDSVKLGINNKRIVDSVKTITTSSVETITTTTKFDPSTLSASDVNTMSISNHKVSQKNVKDSKYMTLLHLLLNKDSSPSINLDIYDSLLTKNLINSNIYSEYQLLVINSAKDSSLQSIGVKPNNPLFFKIPLDNESRYLCQLAIKNPNLSFLKKMSGIIISSILILSLILFSFIYLLRTIFRQKTLEEIRVDFTHNITHELKTPIATAFAANDALINFSADKSPERREKYLKIVNTQLLKLTNMVERILSIATQENESISLSSKVHLIKDIFEEVICSFEINSSKNIHLSIIPKDLTLCGDYFHITNLMNNLVDNALKYSNETVKIELSAYQRTDFIILKISDNGIGISSANQKRIFDKYYRVPTGNIHNVKGVGLGLYYAKLIIEKHEGSISVESKEGEGSCFIIKLPNCEEVNK